MTVAYGDTDTVAQMLEADTPAGFSDALTTRIDAMREVVSRLIDERTGRSFGVAGVSEERRVSVTENDALLPAPARSISAVTGYRTDEGGVLSDPTELETNQWTVDLRDRAGNILVISGAFFNWSWYQYNGLITVTGIWADSSTDTTIPAEIDWLCNYVSAKTIAEEGSSPSGFVGPDGAVSYPRSPWTHPQVKEIIANYRIPQRMLVL
jgi:hypothetical protein